MTKRQRVASAGFGLIALPASMGTLVSGLTVAGSVFLAAMVVMLAYGGRKLMPGFYGILGRAIIAGLIAGVLVLGPLFRGAMRIVNLYEASRPEEFTIGGTMFIIIFVGAIFGTVVAVTTTFIKTGLGWGRHATNLLTAALILGILLLAPDLRSELIELGAGPWMNIPMFFAAGYLYGWAAQLAFERLQGRGKAKAPEAHLEPAHT